MENEKNNQEFVHKTSGEPLEDTQAEKAVGGQMECADSDYHGACCPKGVTRRPFPGKTEIVIIATQFINVTF